MPRGAVSGATATFITCQRVDVAGDDQVADQPLAASASNAPSEIDDGFASSPANIERDHGVG